MNEVYVAGTGMTAFGKFPDATTRSLTNTSVAAALADAGMQAGDVQMAFFGNGVGGLVTGQEMIRGQAALRHTGLLGVPIVTVENACASASTAFHLAYNAVASGQVDVALAVGTEKMAIADKNRAFDAIGTAIDLEQRAELLATFGGGDEVSADRSLFMDIYASLTRAYAERSGATVADFAEVAVKSHEHAALNPKAQYRNRITVEEVLASRTVSHPLTLLMCSPIGDGSAAVVLTRSDLLRGPERVRVAASVLKSGTDRTNGEASSLSRAVRQAYETAGLGPADLDVVEVHDAAAPAELMAYEELELCPAGDGPKLLHSGRTRLGGNQVVNPSGGLLSKGHPIGATGCAQIVEIADQLRDRCAGRQVPGARVGLCENAGGFLGADNAAIVITILTT
ncbi:MAG: thiolase family protein [Sporichthyaceae bacterium]